MSIVERAVRPVAPRRRRLRRWLGVAVLAYLGVLIVLLALERLFIFVPTTAAESWHDKPDPRFEDLTLHASTGEIIHAWWLPQPGATGVLHYSHGNAGSMFWSWPQLLAHASRDTELRPGDVLGSGTVGTGCILELTPEAVGGWLKPGDVVELTIERLGTLRNPVVKRE